MKKLLGLAIILFCLTACSSDDDKSKTPTVNTEQLLKRWFYSATKTGTQKPQPYTHQACGKDFLEFQANNVARKSIYSADCQQDPTVTLGSYTLVQENNQFTTIIGTETISYTITKLNSKELELEATFNNVKLTYIFTSVP